MSGCRSPNFTSGHVKYFMIVGCRFANARDTRQLHGRTHIMAALDADISDSYSVCSTFRLLVHLSVHPSVRLRV